MDQNLLFSIPFRDEHPQLQELDGSPVQKFSHQSVNISHIFHGIRQWSSSEKNHNIMITYHYIQIPDKTHPFYQLWATGEAAEVFE